GNGGRRMKPRLSLTWKITLLAALTLVLVTCVMLVFAGVLFRISPGNFIVAPAFNRITSVAGQLAQDLGETTVAARSDLLSRFSKEYGVDFFLIDGSGQSLTNTPVVLPPGVKNEMSQVIQR